jgi:branched-chain amino acid transport system permease protein
MTSAFVLACGIQIFYLTLGKGEPVLFIHGNTGSSKWFSRVMDLPGYASYALDMPNFGRSGEMPGDVDLHAYADCVKGFIDALGLKSPIVVAHSLGGAVAQSLALRYPDSVRALVLIDSASPTGLLTPRERYPFIEIMRKDKSILAKAFTGVAPTLKDQAFFDALVDDATRMAEKAWIGNAEALSHFDVSDKTASFKKPVLVIWGMGDYLVTREMAEATAKAYPAATFMALEGVGHSVIAEDPARFSVILKEFIDSL